MNKESDKDKKVKKSVLSYRDKIKFLLREIKIKKGCTVCGYKEHWASLDFHHRNPKTKLFTISQGKNIAKKKILQEIKKCDILCANCHRRIR